MKLILIAGMSGSGKTSIANGIYAALSDIGSSSLISTDDYYKNFDGMKKADKARLNFDCPTSIDFDLLKLHVGCASRGEVFDRPVYSFSQYQRTTEVVRVPKLEYLIIEGILAFHDPELRKLSTSRIFVNTSIETCFKRRLQRDIIERGRTKDSVTKQWQKTVLPMAIKYVIPSKEFATKVIET